MLYVIPVLEQPDQGRRKQSGHLWILVLDLPRLYAGYRNGEASIKRANLSDLMALFTLGAVRLLARRSFGCKFANLEKIHVLRVAVHRRFIRWQPRQKPYYLSIIDNGNHSSNQVVLRRDYGMQR